MNGFHQEGVKNMQRFILMALTISLGLLAGCSNVNKKMAEGIREGQRQYSRGNFLGAERVLTGAVSVEPENPAVAEAYYIRGLARLKLMRHSVAEQDFQRALRLTDREDLRGNAHVCLGSIAWEDEEWDTAYQHYRLAADSLTLLSPSDWILFRLASSAQRSGRWEEGRKYFARILREYPDSETTRAARKNLSYWYFTIQLGAFSTPQAAFARVAELKRYGLKTKVYPMTAPDGRALKGVFLGRYNDYYQATKGLIKVRRIVSEARIVP